MKEPGYTPMLDEAGHDVPIVTTNKPGPEPGPLPFRVVQPFPTVIIDTHGLVVPPREYSTLTRHPSIDQALAA